MELEWKAPLEIDDGVHTGAIVRVVFARRGDKEQYSYTDVFIEIDGTEGQEIKYGCPTNLSPKSKLGRLMISLGSAFELGKKVNVHDALIGKRVKFQTMKKGDFSEVVEDSIKLNLETGVLP